MITHGIKSSLFAAVVLGALFPGRAHGDLVINEFVASNNNCYTNALGENPDWIEIHNNGGTPVSLSGWYLTDDATDLTRWAFPVTNILAGEYMVVSADGATNKVISGELHADLKLSTSGEYLALVYSNGTVTIVHDYSDYELSPGVWGFPPQQEDISYGIDATGNPKYFAPPTPGAVNAGGAEDFVRDTKFSPDRGLYTNAILVEITSETPAAAIHYTLDGALPTTNSPLYAAPIPVAKTTTLRARAFKYGFYPTDVDTHTYIFPAAVLNQPANPPGFPNFWGYYSDPAWPDGKVPADYEMDPEIVTNAVYAGMVLEALTALPSLSILSDTASLFDETDGIYAHPLDEGIAWERAASAELIRPDGQDGFQIDCALRIYGGGNRRPTNCAKHSFRLLFKRPYGRSKLSYDLFATNDTAVSEFDTIVLRGAFENTWLHWASDQRNRAQYVRDQWARDVQRAMEQPSAHGRFLHLYVNGLYWGIFNVAERPDAAFAASYLGGEKGDYDALNSGAAVDGDTIAWNTMMNMANAGLANNAEYEAIQQYADVPSLIDYMIVNLYGGNTDWDGHNWYAARKREAGAGFRFFCWDSEHTLENTVGNRITVNNNGNPSRVFQQLRANAEFRLLFADHLHRWFFNDGPLTAASTVQAWRRRSDEIKRAIPAESARWGDYRRDVHPWSGGPYELYTYFDHWVPQSLWLTNTYFSARSDIVLQQFIAGDLYPTIAAPSFNQHGGMFTDGFQLSINPTDAIYYTLNGTDPRLYGTGQISAAAVAYTVPRALSYNVQVKARATSGTDSWSALNEAIFTHATPSPLRITEIMYNPRSPSGVETSFGTSRSDFEFIELQNTSTQKIGLAGIQISDGILFDFTGSDVLTLDSNEFVVVVKNMAAFAARYPSWTTLNIAGTFQRKYSFPTPTLANEGERIILEDALGRTIQSFNYNDTWQPSTDGGGYSLVILDAQGDPAGWDSWSSWWPSAAIDGSPGYADVAAAYPRMVLINEILTHQDTYPPGDWIELYNPTGDTIDMSGWRLSDDTADLGKYAIPGGTELPAGGYLLLTESGAFGTNAIGARRFGLSELGEEAYLSTAAGAIIDRREFGAAERDVTFGRHVKSDGVAVDFTAQSAGTSGSSNAYPKVGPVVISEIMYHPASPADYEFIELYNLSDSAVALYDVAHPTHTWRVRGAVDYAFPSGSTLPAHGYAVLAPVDRGSFEAVYGALPAGVALYGPYTGKLNNAGETIYLSKPGDPEPVSGVVPQILVERVNYGTAAPWPGQADGLGPSLERIVAAHYGNDAANWASLANRGSPGLPPPVILIASPASGTTFSVPFSTTVSAAIDGTQVSGAIQRVDFLVNGSVVATDLAAPWQYLLDHTLITNAGAYTLTARMVDGAGTNTSPAVVIHTTMATRIAVTAPYPGAGFLAPPPASIVATVYSQFIVGAIQRVEFLVDGSPLGVDADTSAPYQFPLTALTNQTPYRLSAVLEDDFGVSTSEEITIHVYTNAPLTAVVDAQTVNVNRYNTTPLNAGLDLRGWSAGLVSTTWTLQSGPGAVVINDATLPVTSAHFSVPGTYVFMLITYYGTHSETNYTTVTVLDANIRNAIPYQESFEGYFDGKPIVGIDGWEADAVWAGTVVTGDYAAFYTNTPPLSDAEHELVLKIDGLISNLFEDTALYSNVWVDTMIEAGRWAGQGPPDVSASAHLAFYIDTDGYLNLWSCVTPGTGNSNAWTRLEHAPLPSNAWVRVTLEADYNRKANGYFYFRAWLNETPLTQPATWFASANTNRNYFSKFTILGEYGIDDVVVADYDILNPPPIQIASPDHGTAFKVPFSTVVAAAIDGTRVSGSIERVDFAVNDVIVASASSAPWQFVLDHTVITNAGDYLLRAFLVDASGTTASPRVRINATMATRIVVTAPVNGAAYVAPPPVSVAAAVDSQYIVGNISRVEFLANGSPLGVDADASAPYEFPLTALTNQATYRLSAVVEDDFMASSSGEITIHVFTNTPLTTTAGTPTVNIGRYNTAFLDGAVDLRGWSTSLVSTAWSLYSGPGSVVIGNASQPATSAGFSAPGTYVFMLITTYGVYSQTHYVTVTVLDANIRNTIPYAESFEEHSEGYPIMGLDGWEAAGLWTGTVVTDDYAAVHAGPYPLLEAEHSRVLRVDGVVSNLFQNTAPYTNIWVDAVFEARRCDVSQRPAMAPATQGGFCFDSDGYINAWNCVTPGAGHSNAWTKLQHSPVPADAWARVTLEVDYNRWPDGHFYFRLWLNGTPLTQPATWFAAASTNRNYLSALKATGAGAFDDMVVDDYDLLNYRKLTASVSGNGTIQPAGEVLVPIHGDTNFVVNADPYYIIYSVERNDVPVPGPFVAHYTSEWDNVISRGTIHAVIGAELAAQETPVWWLVQQGWTSNFDYYALLDYDGDGLATWEEYIAGTHATNAASVFEITAVTRTTRLDILYWQGASNRHYSIYRTFDLSGGWPSTAAVSNIAGVAGTNSRVIPSTPTNQAFYRLEVHKP